MTRKSGCSLFPKRFHYNHSRIPCQQHGRSVLLKPQNISLPLATTSPATSTKISVYPLVSSRAPGRGQRLKNGSTQKLCDRMPSSSPWLISGMRPTLREDHGWGRDVGSSWNSTILSCSVTLLPRWKHFLSAISMMAALTTPLVGIGHMTGKALRLRLSNWWHRDAEGRDFQLASLEAWMSRTTPDSPQSSSSTVLPWT